MISYLVAGSLRSSRLAAILDAELILVDLAFGAVLVGLTSRALPLGRISSTLIVWKRNCGYILVFRMVILDFLVELILWGYLWSFLDTKLVLTSLSLGTIFVGLAIRALLVVNS